MTKITHSACPTQIVEAPFETVWQLLTDFSGWGNFYDVRVNRVEPAGPAADGQTMFGESGPRWLHLKVQFQFTNIDEAHGKLEIQVRMPLGIKVHEDLDCLRIDERRCRVNYHCNFTFPIGLRGRLLRFLLRRELDVGPADSIARLKRAAERDFLPKSTPM